MKYLTYKGDLGVELHVFTPHQSHAAVAERLGWKSVRSAGFIRLTEGKLVCSGFSESLNVASMATDSALATAFFK